jgi:hypothetical protein
VETTLFDCAGYPVAYVADDSDNSIYLWSGDATAYVHEGRVFGFNGRHLGFFVDGVLCDGVGRRVGSTFEKCWCGTQAEPVKQPRKGQREKYERYEPTALPSLGNGISPVSLEAFLSEGIAGLA